MKTQRVFMCGKTDTKVSMKPQRLKKIADI
jgi:hypothetical protein